MTSITARNSAALKARHGSTVPETPAPKRAPRKQAVAQGNKAVAPSNEAPTEVVAPSNNQGPTPVSCRCGCGIEASLGRSYRPGHDARHAGAVARAVIEGKTGASDALAALPPKLQDKANRMVANAAAKATKQAAARELREAMQAELKAKLAAL